MKKEKKVYSLVTEEVLNVITSLMFVAAFIVSLVNPQNQTGQLIRLIFPWAFAAIYFGINVLRCFVKFDIEDEAAVEHYNKAKRKIFDFVWKLCYYLGGVGVLLWIYAEVKGFGIVDKWFLNISFIDFMFVYYLIQLAISLCFIYYEKREA